MKLTKSHQLSLAKTILYGEMLHRTRGDPVDTEQFGSDQKVIKYSWWKAAVAANTKLRCIRNDSRPAYLWTRAYITVKIQSSVLLHHTIGLYFAAALVLGHQKLKDEQNK